MHLLVLKIEKSMPKSYLECNKWSILAIHQLSPAYLTFLYFGIAIKRVTLPGNQTEFIKTK